MCRYTFHDNTLIFEAGQRVIFPFPVAAVVGFGSVAVVRLAVPPGAGFNENVFGVSADGIIVWQVAKRADLHGDSPYTAIQRHAETALLVNRNALRLTVDAPTGRILAEDHGA